MPASEFKEDPMLDEGIIIETSLDILRKGAKKVLYEFKQSIIDMNGEPKASDSEIGTGDTVLFVENMPTVPARIVAVYIIRNYWYVNATSETPRGGYPSGRDAMKAAELDEHNLRILERFLIEEEGGSHVKDIKDGMSDLRSEAANVLNILKQAIRKWHH
ncbi:MAG: hypothetical protein ACFFCP_19295 [Promethearchaeota archaeon]